MDLPNAKMYRPDFFRRKLVVVMAFLLFVFNAIVAISSTTTRLLAFPAALVLLLPPSIFLLAFLYAITTLRSMEAITPRITVHADRIVLTSQKGMDTTIEKAGIAAITVKRHSGIYSVLLNQTLSSYIYRILLKNPDAFIRESVESGRYVRPHYLIRATDYFFLGRSIPSSFREATSSDKKDNIAYLQKVFRMRGERSGFHIQINTARYQERDQLSKALYAFLKRCGFIRISDAPS